MTWINTRTSPARTPRHGLRPGRTRTRILSTLSADQRVVHRAGACRGTRIAARALAACLALILAASNSPGLAPALTIHAATRPLAPTEVSGYGPLRYTVVAGNGSFEPLPESALLYDGRPSGGAADATVDYRLPFAYRFYNRTYPAGAVIHISTKGNIQFDSNDDSWLDGALPAPIDGVILGLWGDYSPGIYAATSGEAPNRVLTVEYRGAYYFAHESRVDFQMRLFENADGPAFDVTYRELAPEVDPGVTGVQDGTGSSYTQYQARETGAIVPGMRLSFYAPVSLRRLDAVVRIVAVGRGPTALAADPVSSHTFVASGATGDVACDRRCRHARHARWDPARNNLGQP